MHIDISDEEKRKSVGHWFKVGCLALFLLLLLIALLLFLPVNKEQKPTRKATAPVTVSKKLPGPDVVGQTRYEVTSAKTLSAIDSYRKSWKGRFIVVSLRVTNLASKPRTLDYSMVKLLDEVGQDYVTDVDATERLYRALRSKPPWYATLRSNIPVSAVVAFSAPFTAKGFKLVCRDLDWRSTETIEIDLGL